MDYELDPKSRAVNAFQIEINEESDRGAALMAGALLDEQLADILREYMAKVPATNSLLDGFNAPLGTFSSRLLAAYALSLISELEFKAVTTIKKIRNEFAHNWKDLNFENQKIADLCKLLPDLPGGETIPEMDSRDRFSFVVAILVFELQWRSEFVKREPRANLNHLFIQPGDASGVAEWE